jgi:caffeoyl-CoA O-methyltransferase
MKHGLGKILRPAQESYLDRLIPPRDPLLAEMEAQAHREDVPVSDPEVGRLLTIFARATGARRILEIGTAIGYGALCLARGAPAAGIVSIDTDLKRLATARAYLERAGVADRVELLQGAALDLLPHLEGPFDLVYIDAVKREYRRYLDLVLPRLRVGGMVVVDNLLWAGEVAEPTETDATTASGAGSISEDEANANALRAFNGYLMMHPQLDAVVLAVGDGIGVATKTRPLRSEMGGPF